MIAGLIGASSPAQTPAKANPAQPSIYELLRKARTHVVDVLGSPRPPEELAQDAALFTKRFQINPAQRGLAWKTWAAAGEPVAPGAFEGSCSANTSDIAFRRMAEAAAAANSKPLINSCDLPAKCKAYAARESGCYKLQMDVCISSSGEVRIDKLTDGTRFTELDFKTPAKNTACSREVERIARESKPR